LAEKVFANHANAIFDAWAYDKGPVLLMFAWPGGLRWRNLSAPAARVSRRVGENPNVGREIVDDYPRDSANGGLEDEFER
jgi:hypothetical protein